MNGFTVRGPSVCTGEGAAVSCTLSGSGSGIRVSLGADDAEIRNGIVTGAAGGGIDVLGTGTRIEDVRVERNALYGIYHVAPGIGFDIIAGPVWVKNCTAVANGGNGIASDFPALVVDSSARQNAGSGFSVLSGSSLRGNEAFANGGDGFSVVAPVLLAGNTSRGNGAAGFGLTGSSVGYVGNVVSDNTSATVSGTGVEIGANLCETNTTCP